MKPSARVLYFLLLSATAACLLLTVAHFSHAKPGFVEEPEKLVIGGLFISGCVLCVSMTIRPNWLRQSWKFLARRQIETGYKISAGEYVAHHPDCDGFRHHKIVLGAIEFCSGCFGLLIGSVISVVMMTAYLVLNPDVASIASSLAIAIGFSAVFFTFIVSLQQKRGPLLNTVANICMIPGLCLLTIGMLEITGNFYAGLLSILFSFLWVDTRIQISQWRHSVTCRLCPSQCKVY